MFQVLDLFSGIGGFSLGLESTGGFETCAFCEIDTDCRAVLRRHWPNTPIYSDVKELDRGTMETDGVRLPDIITAGWPCQDISTAGQGDGLRGDRSGLWSEVARLVDELDPRLVILENSPNLRNRGLEWVLSDLWSFGFDAEWHVVPASAVGAFHQRETLDCCLLPTHRTSEIVGTCSTRASNAVRVWASKSACRCFSRRKYALRVWRA